MDKKRLVLIIIFLLVCLTLGTLMYFVFFKKTPILSPDGKTTTSQKKAGELPSAGDRKAGETAKGSTNLPSTGGQRAGTAQKAAKPKIKVEQVVQNGVVSPSVAGDGSVKFYNKQDGHFYKMNAAGKMELMTDQVFFNVQNVVWSPKDEKSIIEYPDGSNIYYNFNEKKQVTLPKHWESFSFQTDGVSIAAKSDGLSPENKWIVTSDPDGKNIKLIEHMGENGKKVDIKWSPNQQIIGTSLTGDVLGNDRQEVLFVGLHNENFRSMVVEGRGFQSSWSPKGDKMLYSVYSARSDFKPELWVVDAQPGTIGNERKLLGVNTWPEKCAYADDRTLYCGVPKNLPTGAGIAPAVAEETYDEFYKIDTQTGIKTQVNVENSGPVVDKMFLGEDGKTMYFTDKQRPGIFKVQVQ